MEYHISAPPADMHRYDCTTRNSFISAFCVLQFYTWDVLGGYLSLLVFKNVPDLQFLDSRNVRYFL